MRRHLDWRAARQRLKAPLLRIAQRRFSPRSNRRLLVVAGLLFLAVTAAALPRLEAVELNWTWLAVAGLVSFAVIATNAAELWLAGSWLNVRIRPSEALKVSILATAANLAPLPGAVIVRARDLFSRGADSNGIARALASIGVSWVGISLIAASFAVAVAGTIELATVGILLSAVLVPVLSALRPEGVRTKSLLLGGAAVELLAVAAQATRYYAIFRSLGIDADWHHSMALPLAGAVASAAGLFPGGLGLRELLAGGMAEVVALPASSGIVVSALDRVVGLVVLGSVALLLVIAPSASAGSYEDPKVEQE